MESYLNEAFERFEGDEAHIQLFLQDLDNWKSHYSMLQSTSSFLMEACDENIASNLQQKMAVIHCNWSYLLQVNNMAITVVEFSREGCKIRKVFG